MGLGSENAELRIPERSPSLRPDGTVAHALLFVPAMSARRLFPCLLSPGYLPCSHDASGVIPHAEARKVPS